VSPWTIRNAHVVHAFIPMSLSEAASYGTFNPDSAADPVYPYLWRALPPSDADIFDPRHPLPDRVWHARAQHRALTYVRHHPEAVPKAFFWNGITRLWDLRRPAHVLNDVKFEGRTRSVAKIAMVSYWLMLPFALFALWSMRRRREIVWPILALALSASLVFTTAALTRYRATLEPLVVILACYGALHAYDRLRARRGAPAEPATPVAGT
jgi:hypothetical protein